MTYNALTLANSRLLSARNALIGVEKAKSYDEFFAEWFAFLTAWKSIYTTLQQGVKIDPAAIVWFAEKQSQRRKDPLLQYLYQARNDEEHGLKRSVESSLGSRLYHYKPGQKVYTHTDPVTGMPSMTDADTGQPLELVNEHPAGPVLVVVTDQNKKEYWPPIAHLGSLLEDRTPLGVARVGLEYLEALVAEAELLLGTSL